MKESGASRSTVVRCGNAHEKQEEDLEERKHHSELVGSCMSNSTEIEYDIRGCH